MIKKHSACLIGEHVFIPMATETVARHTHVRDVFCQHCLLIVPNYEWLDIENERQEEAMGRQALSIAKHQNDIKQYQYNSDIKEYQSLPYPGKKRGRKPKNTV